MRRPVGKTSWFTIMLIVVAVALWVLDQKRAADSGKKPEARETGKPSAAPQPKVASAEKPPSKPGKAGVYEIYQNCVLVDARNNDGDSFMLRLPDGRKAEFRLYFVDTPESAFKRYAGGETNHERIRQQAAELGGITPEQAVEIGKKGKASTHDLLEKSPFTIYTAWDSPYDDQRYHAFVEVLEKGRKRWLHELLVERGLVRIKTKPADLPDGTTAARHKDRLRELESQAKRSGTGVWGL